MRSLQDELPPLKAPATDIECLALEVTPGTCRQAHTHLCPDTHIRLFFNGQLLAAQAIYPRDFEAFATGLLLAEGLIGKAQDILALELKEDTILVRASEAARPAQPGNPVEQVDLEVIFRGYLSLDDMARICRATGGTHCALLMTAHGGLVACAEDVHRLSGTDKAIGKAALAGYDLGECLLLTTGRITEDIVRHAATAGLSLVAGCGAPSSRAVKLALARDITLLAIPGPHQVIIYSGKERIREKEWRHPDELDTLSAPGYRYD